MKQQEILFLLGSAVIVVFVWIAFTVIHNSLTSTISENLNQIIVPIDPTFDTKTITAMSKKTIVGAVFNIQPTPTTTAATPTPSPTPIPIATQSAQISTSGGTLQ